MENKFSALAKDKYLDFLIWQNVYALTAYVILAVLFALVLQPFLSIVCRRFAIRACYWKIGSRRRRVFPYPRLFHPPPRRDTSLLPERCEVRVLVLRNSKCRPRRSKTRLLLRILHRHAPARRALRRVVAVVEGFAKRQRNRCRFRSCHRLHFWFGKTGVLSSSGNTQSADTARPNVIIIGSDSLRSDRLGCNGYHARRTDGLAAGGVSPRIDALAPYPRISPIATRPSHQLSNRAPPSWRPNTAHPRLPAHVSG